MSSEATRAGESKRAGPVLYMALELSDKTWRVLFAAASGRRRERVLPARELERLIAEIAAAKRRLGLAPDAGVVSCYEAGRDGFWLHRALEAHGIANLVVDAASIAVPRRARRAKTDRLDVARLMGLLVRFVGGERGVWSVVRVPGAADEDLRQLSRAIARLKAERARHTTRIKALLATQGLKLARVGGPGWAARVAELRQWDGRPLGRWLLEDLVREGERLALVEAQLHDLKAERDRVVADAPAPAAVAARKLARLGAIAAESAFVFATELFGWRTFANRRELAGAVGVTPTPFASGGGAREQGIAKTGNARMRTMLVEIAWGWLRYQPDSALARWWRERFAASGGRARKSAIVALARKLLVALWRYLEHDIVPDGARVKGRAAP